MGSELTPEDYNDLIDAVEAWEKEGRTDSLLGHILTGITVPSAVRRTPEFREQSRADWLNDPVRISRKDRAIVLHAKLLALRNGL